MEPFLKAANDCLRTQGMPCVEHKECLAWSTRNVFIETQAMEGLLAESGEGITVGISTELNEDLILEGLVREVVRSVQSMRKNAGVAGEARIEISWDFDGKIAKALGKFEGYFISETLTNKITDDIKNFDHMEGLEVSGKNYKIKLKKI